MRPTSLRSPAAATGEDNSVLESIGRRVEAPEGSWPSPWRRAVGAIVVGVCVLGACGSDGSPQQPRGTAPVSVIDARQGAGPGGANNNGRNTGDTTDVPPTTATATADTQEQIGDQSPGGGGDSNGLPSESMP